MTTFARAACIVTLTALVSGCVSIQSTVARVRPDYNALPADAVADLTLTLERGVIEGEREPDLPDGQGFVVDTPEVRQALRSRAARVELVQDILNRGHAWERRNGKISILRTRDYKRATTSRERDRDALFVISENRDRVALYESLADANNLNPSARSALEQLFQQARIDLMEAGQKYEAGPDELAIK